LYDGVIYAVHVAVWWLCSHAADGRIQDQISQCPFVKLNIASESGRKEVLDVAFTAQAVLRGMCHDTVS